MPTILDCTYHPSFVSIAQHVTTNVGASNNINLLSPSFHELGVQHMFAGSSAQVSQLGSRCQPAASSSRGPTKERPASRLTQVVVRLSPGSPRSEVPTVLLAVSRRPPSAPRGHSHVLAIRAPLVCSGEPLHIKSSHGSHLSDIPFLPRPAREISVLSKGSCDQVRPIQVISLFY